MKFLANENVPKILIESLLRKSQEVNWIKQSNPGISDMHVLELARRESCIILTFDKDYGELIYRVKLKSAGAGIILLRFWMEDSIVMANNVAGIICSRNDWNGYFSVIEPDKIRMRKLPD